MKLLEWLEGSTYETFSQIVINAKDKHVISTCPSCEHYEKWEPVDMCNSPLNRHFGCVYWSEKK